MNEFKRFEDRLTGLIESLSPSGRRRLSAELAKRLRQNAAAPGDGTESPGRHTLRITPAAERQKKDRSC
ncbi:hypothetical protein ACLB1E_37680 [Escherichia coli]